ncbi:uncharacterized protein [Musca autumnalis]|uniref:uncharacterized protein n=1 Tax=Musca autumnalis TaxID=221902 RepID=UPI003CEAD005
MFSDTSIRLPNSPSSCNILGISYRVVSIGIACLLLMQDLSLIITYSQRHEIPCSLWHLGIDSLVIQHGEGDWALTGLYLAILCLATNTSLLWGAIWRKPTFVVCWYLGGIPQFFYLLSLQIFCLFTETCNRCDRNDWEYRRYYNKAFFIGAILTWYLYSTFAYKIHLFYQDLVYLHEEASLKYYFYKLKKFRCLK